MPIYHNKSLQMREKQVQFICKIIHMEKEYA